MIILIPDHVMESLGVLHERDVIVTLREKGDLPINVKILERSYDEATQCTMVQVSGEMVTKTLTKDWELV